MSDPGCQSSLQSKFVIGDCSFISPRNEQNMNSCTHLTNTSLVLQDGSTEISAASVLKNNDGLVSPVLTKEHVPPILPEKLFSSDCYSAANSLGNSNMSLSYFTDPNLPYEEQESSETSLDSNKYFSTPMPSKERVKKKLTPVLEVDSESNMLEEWQPQETVSRIGILHKNCAEVLLQESPTKTPLYRSFFAAECQEIVHQIKNVEENVSNRPCKRKEEADISTIDAEPPPYDTTCTPMKSMLVCEVVKMMRSLESSGVKESSSIFGESLLDVEKTDVLRNDFNLSDFIKHDKRHSLSNAERLTYLNDRLDGVCIKRQKTDCGVDSVNQATKVSPLPNVFDGLIPEFTDSRASTTSIHEEMTAANVTQPNELLPPRFNTTYTKEGNIANTTHLIETSRLSSGSTTQDSILVHEDAVSGNTQLMDVLVPSVNTAHHGVLSSNTTQDMMPMHEVVTVAVIEAGPQLTNASLNLPSSHHSKTANTTHEIEVVLQSCLNTTKDIAASVQGVDLMTNTSQVIETAARASATTENHIAMSTHEMTTSCAQDLGVRAILPVDVLPLDEAGPNHCNDVAEEHDNIRESFDAPLSETVPANSNCLLIDVVQPSLDIVLAVSAQHSVVIRDIDLPDTTGTNTEIPVLNSDDDLNEENKMDLGMLNHHKHVSKFDPTQTFVVNERELSPVEVGRTTVLTCPTVEPTTLVGPPAQAKLDVTEGHKLEEHVKDCSTRNTGMVASQKEVTRCKESSRLQLVSDSCSMIHEEENVHDVSVFSVGSLSFVTSTPVPGLNVPCQKTCRESVKQDSTVSIGSVSILDDCANKERSMITQHSPHDAQELTCNDQCKQTAHMSLLPSSMQRRIMPLSEAMPMSFSGIPSVRRSLALHENTGQNPSRDLAVSKIATRCIQGRGMSRPPMPRQNLPRPSLGNPKAVVNSAGGSSITSKLTANKFRAPKAAAAVVKLPVAISSAKPPSRLPGPGTTGRFYVGCPNAATSLHDAPSGESVSVVLTQISTGIRSGLVRPGTSSVRPPLPLTQKVSPKLKSQVQGLLAKKNPRELPTLRREIASKAESKCGVKATAKQASRAPDVTKEAASFQAGFQKSSSPNHSVQTKAENDKKLQSSLSSNEELASILASSTESAEIRKWVSAHRDM